MTNRERLQMVLNGEKPDRLPMYEWASWWDQTVEAWEKQGMPKGWNQRQIEAYYGLDPLVQFWMDHRSPQFPEPVNQGMPVIESMEDYERLKPLMYSKEKVRNALERLQELKYSHEKGEIALWFSLEGFFWFPRSLMGIENHLYGFYDEPELMHRINRDQLEYGLYVTEEICKITTPEFMTIAEDMSYNHGPMLSKDMYDVFLKPYYRELVPLLKEKNIRVFIDTDGDVEPLIPWFKEVGIEGVLPLERQAGVDVNRIRSNHSDWLMIGGFDKTIMHLGEQAMRKEFERIQPAMRSGRYIAAVDHQTPPDVSIENYRTYVKLLSEQAYICCNS